MVLDADLRRLTGRGGRVGECGTAMSNVRPYPDAQSDSSDKPRNKGEPLINCHLYTFLMCFHEAFQVVMVQAW